MVIHIHIPCDCKCKFNSTTNWNNETCQCDCEKYCKCKNDYSWNATTCICEKSKHLKHICNGYYIDKYGKYYSFNCYLVTPQSLLGQYWMGSLTHLMLITAFLHIPS